MKSRKELIDTVVSIGEDAKDLFDIASNKASGDGSLTKAEINRIKTLTRRSEKALSDASERAKARRAAEIKEMQSQIDNIDASLSMGLPSDTVKFLKRKKRNLRARLHDRQVRAALDFGGIISAADLANIQASLSEAKHAVARRKKADGFIKSLFQIMELATNIASKATGIF